MSTSTSYKPGDTVYVEFCTQVFATGVATNADTTPTATLNRNGTDDGAVTVTVTNIDAGRYKAVFTIPTTYVPGDVLNLTVAATVSSVAGKAAIWHAKLGVGFVSSGTATAGGGSTITLQTALGTDNLGRYAIIVIVAGTGAGQTRVIQGYVNSTKVVTVDRAWITNPDSTSVYTILYGDQALVDATGAAAANATEINSVSTSAVTTVNANIGTTQPTNFTGAGASAFVQVDVQDWLAHAVTVDSNNAPNVSAKYWAGTAITATSIPVATAAGASGGLLIAGSNAATTFATGSHFIGTVDTVTTVTNQLTAAAIATGVWQDSTAGDFTTVGSIGKSLFTSGNAPGAASGLALVGSNMGTVSSIVSPGNIWDVVLASHLTAGSTGFALNAAGSAGDPWATAIPGAYGAGTAGFIVGTNLDTTVSSRAAAATALSTVQWTNTLATNLGTLASHDPGATIGTSTLTQAQVTGGAYALNSASFAFNAALDFTTTEKASIAASAVASVTGTVGGIAGTTQTLDSLQTALSSTHGAGSWATATGFAVPGDAMTLTTAGYDAAADALLGRNVGGGSSSGRLVKEALYVLRNRVNISGTTQTVYDTAGVSAWTATVTPDGTAQPITDVTPA